MVMWQAFNTQKAVYGALIQFSTVPGSQRYIQHAS